MQHPLHRFLVSICTFTRRELSRMSRFEYVSSTFWWHFRHETKLNKGDLFSQMPWFAPSPRYIVIACAESPAIVTKPFLLSHCTVGKSARRRPVAVWPRW